MTNPTPTARQLEDLRSIAFATAQKWLTASGGHEAEDVAQDALADYVAYAATHDVDTPPALMRLIAKRRALKYQAAWKAHKWPTAAIWIEDDPSPDGGGNHVVGDIADLGTTLEQFESLDALRWAITQLQPGYRQIAELTFLGASGDDASGVDNLLHNQLDASEVAERLGLAPGTVKNRLVKIRSALHGLLAEDP